MKTRIIISIVVALVSVGSVFARDTGTASPNGAADTNAAGLDAKALLELSAAMQKQVEDRQVSGLIALIARDGGIGYHETFGDRRVASDDPMTRDTLFRIFSMTKPIVAATAMALWEEGKFKLDDPISNHLPEWKDITVRENGKTVPARTPVTPRHLMTHSSGLTYGKAGLNLGRTASLEEFSQSIAARPLKFHPGTDFTYGYSIDILGRYIEAITGKTLDVVMRERIFDRLGMNNTGFWVPNPADRNRVAMAYNKSMKGELRPAIMLPVAAVMRKPARMMGGQGLMSTSGDYARFCQMLLNKGELDGEQVLKPETVELMFRNHLRDIGKVYGLGGIVDGKGSYSWGGAAGTKFWVDHRSDSYVVFMIQTWGYKAPTYMVFEALAKRAIGKGK